MKRGYVDTPEGQVHYRTEGSGKPVLLLHHVGLSSDQFSEVIAILGKSRQAIAMDFLGYGNSDMPSRLYQVEDYARNVIHFLDALKIKKTDVVGRFLGASVAVEMAVAYPARVNKLILSSCPYREPEAQKARLDFYRNKRMEIKEDGSHLMNLWKEHLAHPHMNLEMCQRALVDYLRSGLGARAEDGHIAVFSYDIASKLPAIKSPTLLLYSATDSFLRRLEATRSLIPMSQTKIIEGTRHFPAWEKPQEFAQAIFEFLEKGVV